MSTTKRQIKYIANAVKWFDKVNGNTYHSVRVIRCSDGKVLPCEWQYGYGEQYKQTALTEMVKSGWLDIKPEDIWSYERENNYPIEWTVRHGLKREMIANGRA